MPLNRPVRFFGSDEEIKVNRRTHFFTGDEGRCVDCDCRMFGTLSTWPCGSDVPREIVSNDAAPVSAWEAIVRSPSAPLNCVVCGGRIDALLPTAFCSPVCNDKTNASPNRGGT